MSKLYAVTFGQKYRHAPHPVLGMQPQLPDGWALVEANDYHHARWLTASAFGTAWSWLYELSELDTKFFPLGQLFTLTLDTDNRPVVRWTAPVKGTP